VAAPLLPLRTAVDAIEAPLLQGEADELRGGAVVRRRNGGDGGSADVTVGSDRDRKRLRTRLASVDPERAMVNR
jgi:hypothetical protein